MREKVPLRKRDAQAFADFLWMEATRHLKDIANILEDLKEIERRWGVKPSWRFTGKWVVVRKEDEREGR